MMNENDYAQQASEIFVLSDSFIRIKELIDDDNSTIDDIADVIILDPALAGTILKLANSSLFSYPGKIDTISKAVLVLGITEVYNLVIAFFTSRAFKALDVEQDYLDDFWCKSVDCALIVKYLGVNLRIPNAERLFLIGLLHNLGELVVQQIAPEKAVVANKFTATELPWDKQKKTLGFTYADCAAELLKQWQLPFSIIEPIRNQDNSDFTYSTDEIKLLYLSKRIMLSQFDCSAHDAELLFPDNAMQQLLIDDEMLQGTINYCDFERLSILSIINPSAATIF
ncbi:MULTISPECIES: HDOD domain-containing protein [unclassified Colwellia]|jgi:HD-like signal output (HDOD) protein|uniref:HDOD domain-containing protein n=1 Tax=unclassified Colwellia TaxID=196834 RepID=UPI001EF3023C|nr:MULTISPECIES: HDOD domain-containing protein [unclassified Colwellia]|tara:strand:- start:577 stop:1425 length:849 start_codon:yes stop_codon:yes gene_type:complete